MSSTSYRRARPMTGSGPSRPEAYVSFRGRSAHREIFQRAQYLYRQGSALYLAGQVGTLGAGDLAPIGTRVLVAWNNSRESARAVFDALPILKRAFDVTVLVVEEAGKPQTTSDHAGNEICATLAQHGVKCRALQVKRVETLEPGVELLARTAALKCDLLVMGCYGHSRFRESVLGGASRYVLQHTKVPVLMAH